MFISLHDYYLQISSMFIPGSVAFEIKNESSVK